MIWGGNRTGAGRPSTGRQKVNFYVTPEEAEWIRAAIDNRRDEKTWPLDANRDDQIKKIARNFARAAQGKGVASAYRYLRLICRLSAEKVFLDSKDLRHICKHLGEIWRQ